MRVVNNINKKMEVKPRFLENFRNEGFADSFPYKQKVPHPQPSCDSQARPVANLVSYVVLYDAPLLLTPS